ncbi:Hypothetical predicted protein [Mytilus galloprovincialis]|uniref:Ig-like domain-containing protein n=1 Tax=Mytilus galloprovincialis TaxID=29158 RepID=A0A8B6EJH3_MYTGA|nr:Hypothetical predicted protein [Mytilus galloprovincialis]
MFNRSSRKLTASSLWFIIILPVLCFIRKTEELSVNWDIQSPVQFGKTAILNCTIDEKSHVCQNPILIWRWTKHRNQSTSILIFEGSSSNKSKYTETKNENCTESALHIHNFDQSDFALYTCSCGIHERTKELKLERHNYSINSIIFSCSHSSLTMEMEIKKISPPPLCYSTIENGRLKHKIIRTKLAESLYTTEDTIKFVFKVHSCSGTIRSFCRFKSIEIEVFNRTYDCCSVNNNSVVKTVVIGVAIAITFVVIVFVVYLFRSKIKDCKHDCIQGQTRLPSDSSSIGSSTVSSCEVEENVQQFSIIENDRY